LLNTFSSAGVEQFTVWPVALPFTNVLFIVSHICFILLDIFREKPLVNTNVNYTLSITRHTYVIHITKSFQKLRKFI